MTLGERIKLLRIRHSMTQKELGQLVNVSTVSVGCWEKGTKKPSIDIIITLARRFCITTDYLLGVKTEPEKDAVLLEENEKRLLSQYRNLDCDGKKMVSMVCNLENSRIVKNTPHLKAQANNKNSLRFIPKYLTPSAAGLSFPFDENDFEMIPVNDAVPQDADFAVRIQGNSMHPYILDGDTVYVKKNIELSVGDIGIFCVDGAMYCKQYYVDKHKRITLVSLNPEFNHTNIYINPEDDSELRCYGKVLLNYKIKLPDYIVKI